MPTRVLCFGASATLGFWDTEGGWVQRIRTYYDSQRVRNYFVNQPTIYNLSISGETSSRLLKRFEQETTNRKFPGEDFAFIFSVGTNNSFIKGNGQPGSTPEEYRADLENLVDKAKKFSDKILLVGFPSCDERRTTPTIWADIHYTNDRLKLFEDIMAEVAEAKRATFVPLFENFKHRQENGEDYFIDGLHLDNSGHEIIAEAVLPKLHHMLGLDKEVLETFSLSGRPKNLLLNRLFELAKRLK